LLLVYIDRPNSCLAAVQKMLWDRMNILLWWVMLMHTQILKNL